VLITVQWVVCSGGTYVKKMIGMLAHAIMARKVAGQSCLRCGGVTYSTKEAG